MLYGSSVWGNFLTRTQLASLQKLQNWGAKLIFGRAKYDSCSDLFPLLRWIRIRDLIALKTSCVAWAAATGSFGHTLQTVFHQPRHSHFTRRHGQLYFVHADFAQGCFSRRSLLFLGPLYLNKIHPYLAQDADSSPDSRRFRATVLDLLRTNPTLFSSPLD